MLKDLKLFHNLLPYYLHCLQTLNDNLFEVMELILVGCRDGDNLRSRWKILGNTSWITAVLVQSNKLRNFVIFINQVDGQPSVVVK